MPTTPRILVAPVVGLLGCVGLVACSAPAAQPTGEPAAVTAGTSDASAFPVTVDNCGVEVTLEAPPERVVTIKSSMTELVLALGAGDRVVGTGFPDGPVPEDLADEAGDLPVLAERVPSSEVVLEARPDLVMAGWESNLTGEGAGERDVLAGLGVATYVAPSACKDPAHQPDRLTFDDVFAGIEEAGRVLGESDAATELVEEQRAALGEVEADDRGLTALWYSSGTDIPYVGAGIGAPQMILDAVGLRNVAADVADTWSSLGWETVAAADPDVVVLVDADWNSAESKKEFLATSPATQNLTAVREERYLVVPFPASEAGVRNVEAASDLARQLAALDLG
ncbi:putative F420-0 ABC transporter substrate-binding protein [Actinotalea sp. AC32]|nr:putative F420-0 ABC transporter substrate-binding protein [Actinotalea sp. AC32]